MSKGWKRFIKIYLVIGVLWATIAKFPFGISLREYEDNSRYYNEITQVVDSYLTDSGELSICFKGRLRNSEMFPSKITDFFIQIPVDEIWSDETFKRNGMRVTDAESNWLYITEESIFPNCETASKSTNVSSVKIELTAKEASSFYFENMSKFNSVKEEEYTVYIIPEAYEYDGYHYRDTLDIYVVGAVPDVAGRTYYKIYLEDTWYERDISFLEYSWAFVKDALFYPVAIVMMGNWGH